MERTNTALYNTLGVKPDATDDEIKRSYRNLAKKYHPDKCKDDNANDMIQKINEAYEVLSDPNKRKIYDQYGEEGLRAGFNPDDMDPMNIFRKMHQQTKQAKQYVHNIRLEEYFTKKKITISIPKEIDCDSCNQTGFTDKKRHLCKQCNGTGMFTRVFQQGPMIQQMSQPCPLCRGSKIDNQYYNIICNNCKGKGIAKIKEEVEVDIPYNITRNPMTILPNKGPTRNGMTMDLAIVFKLKMSKNFTLTSDKKLIYTMRINFTETICGFRRLLEHPSGKKLLIVSEKGYVVNPDNIYILEGQGFNGDIMYLTFIVNYPEKINMSKRKTYLDFESLEDLLGPRKVPNDTSNDIDPQYIYTLSTINKINNNPRAKENEAPSDDERESDDFDNNDSDDNEPQSGMPGCAQQ